MDYTLQSIIRRVQVDKLDDDEFDTGIISNYVNDTQRDIFNQFELSFQEKIFVGTLPSHVAMFNAPDDLSLLQRAILSGGDRTRDITDMYVPWRNFLDKYPASNENEPGDFENWTSYAGNIILSRPTEIDQTLTIYYVRKPKVLALPNDKPEIPQEFEELLVLGAYIRCLEFNEDFDQADYIKTEYNNMLDMLVSRYGGRLSPGAVKMANQQIRMRRR